MASIRKDIDLEADAEGVWAAVSGFGAMDKRMAPGFVVESRLDGDRRIVKFAIGVEATETLLSRGRCVTPAGLCDHRRTPNAL